MTILCSFFPPFASLSSHVTKLPEIDITRVLFPTHHYFSVRNFTFLCYIVINTDLYLPRVTRFLSLALTSIITRSCDFSWESAISAVIRITNDVNSHPPTVTTLTSGKSPAIILPDELNINTYKAISEGLWRKIKEGDHASLRQLCVGFVTVLWYWRGKSCWKSPGQTYPAFREDCDNAEV